VGIIAHCHDAAAQPAAEVKTIYYLAPSTATFKEQMANLETKLRAKRPPAFRMEFVEFPASTHSMSFDALAALVQPLADKKPAAIVTPNLDIALAVVLNKIPVQMVVSGIADPVGRGVVKSFANQEVDITGHTRFVTNIDEKRLSLLKEIAPKVRRVGMLMDEFIKQQRLGRSQGKFQYDVDGIEVVPFVISTAAEAVALIEKSKAMRIDAWYIRLMIPNYGDENTRAMVDAVNRQRLPGMYDALRFVRFGGLAAYQQVLIDPDEIWARDLQLLLEGTAARQVPFERPRHFFTTVNTDTAAALGINLPAKLMRRVDLSFPCRTKPPLDCEQPKPQQY
jgi:putative ABC transport system substrate-binding protein